MLVIRPVTSGHQEGEEFSERGADFLNYVQHIFQGVKTFPGWAFPPATPSLVTGPLVMLA